MRYLITGAQGFAGRFLCAAILQTEPDATIVGTGRSTELRTVFTHHITWGRRRFAAPLTAELRAIDGGRYRYVRCDLNDRNAVALLAERSAPDIVIHLAAALRDDPADALIESNVGGTAALIHALAANGRKPRLILGSSGSVYGVPEALPLNEDQRCAPQEPYAMSKLAAELVARVLTAHAGIPAIVARIFNIAGPGQDERHVCGRFAAQAAVIRRGDAPATIESGDLRPTRDFIDVRDVARAILRLAKHGTPGETYNVASGCEVTIGDILKRTLAAADLEEKVAFVQRYVRPADIPRAYADVRKLSACGFAPAFPIDRTISDLLAYYENDVAGAAAEQTTSATS
jgi:GDP-4-dehydro-6-deoxy-D-mannose reductase